MKNPRNDKFRQINVPRVYLFVLPFLRWLTLTYRKVYTVKNIRVSNLTMRRNDDIIANAMSSFLVRLSFPPSKEKGRRWNASDISMSIFI
jgi:hypothetical protein